MQKDGRWATVVVALALVAMFALEATSACLKSPTYDEQGYIARGYAYVSLGDRHILIGTPMMLNAWNALPLLWLPDVHLETDHPTWDGTDFHDVGSHFLWESGNDVDQVMFWARLPTMILSLLLAATAYRWARELYGPRAGWLALLLATLSPNILAHARLATTDLGLAFFFFLATYRLWRYLESPTWGNLVWAGVALGLSQGTKFSALLIAPVWVAIGVVWVLAGGPKENESWIRRGGSLALAGVAMAAVGFFVLWATYGFEIAPLREGSLSLPAATHFGQWLDISGRLAGEETRRAPAFLMGQYSDTGWWYYFPVAFLLKTPLPTLVLLLWAAIFSLRRLSDAAPRHWRRELAVILPPFIYFVLSLTSKLNLGYRYLLPILPFLFVYGSKIANSEWRMADRNVRHTMRTAFLALLIGWYVFGSFCIYPHYLAYFNELAGGPEGGWRYLVDSNIDWGQDAILLQQYLEKHGVGRVKLAWFGESRPEYYGVPYEPLPGWPPDREDVATRAFSPVAPSPGTYAISATNLQGVLLDDRDTYAWFREREPVDKIGYSVFVYEVPRWGEGQVPIDLALSGVGVDQLDLDAFQTLGTNDLALRWFDARSSMVFPAGDGGWYAIAEGTPSNPALAARFGVRTKAGNAQRTRDGAVGYHLYHLDSPGDPAALATSSPVWWSPATAFPVAGFERYELPPPVHFGSIVELLGYEVGPAETQPGGELVLFTYWRVRQEDERSLKIFVHLLDRAGQVKSGQDRLDVAPAGWREGDVFVQVHYLALPDDAATGTYQLEVGWYDGETLARLPVLDAAGSMVADRVLLAGEQDDG